MHPLACFCRGGEVRGLDRGQAREVVWPRVVVRERRVVEEAVFFQQRNGRLAELVEGRAVAAGPAAREGGAEVDAVLEDVALLVWGELGRALCVSPSQHFSSFSACDSWGSGWWVLTSWQYPCSPISHPLSTMLLNSFGKLSAECMGTNHVTLS